MRIGYSFWGFVGEGITDTPDGGRSHRAGLLAALTARGSELVFLQRDRDLLEAGRPAELDPSCRWETGLPALDLLWLEWRWPIPGRNTATERGGSGFTPDLDRQTELVEHYTLAQGVPTLIWDKDLWLEPDDPIRSLPNVVVCEAALYPRQGARRLLFPIADPVLDQAQRQPPRSFGVGELDLVYIGNRYGRDDSFDRYFAPAAGVLPHRVYGKWEQTGRWPDLDFAGRLPFGEVEDRYRSAVATVLLVPERYAAVGQMTQRIFEACLAGCFPLLPASVRGASTLVPEELHVDSGAAVLAFCRRLRKAAQSAWSQELAARCLQHLDVFRLSRQLEQIDDLLGAEAPRR